MKQLLLTNRPRRLNQNSLAFALELKNLCGKNYRTVKAHTRRLYAKLHVNSRTQAVARARELQLLQ